MTNKFNRYNGKTRIYGATFTGGGNYDPATAATRTITFPCKDIRSLLDVHLTNSVGYTVVPIALVHNQVQFRVYKIRMNYAAPAGGGQACTTALVGNALERGGGFMDSDGGYGEVPVELPLAAAVTVTVRGVAIGTR